MAYVERDTSKTKDAPTTGGQLAKPPKKSGSGWLWVLIVIIILLVIFGIVFAWFYTQDDKSATNNNTATTNVNVSNTVSNAPTNTDSDAEDADKIDRDELEDFLDDVDAALAVIDDAMTNWSDAADKGSEGDLTASSRSLRDGLVDIDEAQEILDGLSSRSEFKTVRDLLEDALASMKSGLENGIEANASPDDDEALRLIGQAADDISDAASLIAQMATELLELQDLI